VNKEKPVSAQNPPITATLPLRRSNANHAAGDSLAGVTGTQGVFVAASAEIVLIGLDNNTSADNTVGANQLDQSVLNVYVGDTRLISLNVSCTYRRIKVELSNNYSNLMRR
jgi:hypothetical protein